MRRWVILGCWMGWSFVSGLAEAKSAEEAEYDRLLSEMTKFSKTQSWSGVNKRFGEMEKLGLEIGANELLMAAQASQGLGDIYQAKDRVRFYSKKRRALENGIPSSTTTMVK